jgi:AraC-like DNA-binding protein
MLYLRHPPVPPLAAYVAELWSLADAPPHGAERILPAGTLELVINLAEDELRIYDASTVHRHPGALVSGAYRSHFGIDTREHASIIGVHFRPGGAWPFLGVPPGALADAHVDLATLWGARAGDLRERLCAAPDAGQRFALLEGALLERLAGARGGHPAVARAIAALDTGTVRVADVAADVGISARRLTDVFTAEAGIAPKAFARIARFRRALALARRDRTRDWSSLAAACGYCDQSHMIRDFVAIAGESPTALLGRASERVKDSHVALSSPPASDLSKTGQRAVATVPACGSSCSSSPSEAV